MMKFKHIPDKPTKRELDKTRDRLFKKLKLGVSKAPKHRIISTKEE